MKIRSLNNPAIEKDYQLLKLIAEQLIAIQPLIQQVACLSIIEEHGSHIIDHDGKLKLEARIEIETEVHKQLTSFVADLRQVAMKNITNTDEMLHLITNFNVYQEELDHEFETAISKLLEKR